jgi:hypothetical protein
MVEGGIGEWWLPCRARILFRNIMTLIILLTIIILQALCLKKIKGLDKKVKLVDASFIWTEPHSR